MNIEDFGISKEELIERCVNNLTDTLYEQLEKDISELIVKKLNDRINKRVDAMVDTLCRESFELTFQPVDTWGEPKGEKTTLKEMIKKAGIDYWNDKVNKDGEKQSYGDMRRFEFVAKKVINDVITHDLEHQVKQVFTEVRDAVKKATVKSISEQLTEKL